MKNYLDRLNLERLPDDVEDLHKALEAAASDTIDRQSLVDAEAILSDPVVSEHYMRLHRQYEALAAASRLLNNEEARNSHRWKERLVEFQIDRESI